VRSTKKQPLPIDSLRSHVQRGGGLGFEISDEYIGIANKRINDYLDNNLKIRPLGKPVYKPTGREKVSQIPLSWLEAAA
jgi:hypothetical protein